MATQLGEAARLKRLEDRLGIGEEEKTADAAKVNQDRKERVYDQFVVARGNYETALKRALRTLVGLDIGPIEHELQAILRATAPYEEGQPEHMQGRARLVKILSAVQVVLKGSDPARDAAKQCLRLMGERFPEDG